MTEGMVRVSMVDIIDGNVPRGEKLWGDHVLFDIPPTLAGAVRNAHSDFKAVTIHENIVKCRSSYKEFFSICQERGIEVVVALTGTFERVSYKTYMGRKIY